MKKWNNPTVTNLSVENTNEKESRDPGHGYPEGHIHYCVCGETFDTWAEAVEHEKLGEQHMIGCKMEHS